MQSCRHLPCSSDIIRSHSANLPTSIFNRGGYVRIVSSLTNILSSAQVSHQLHRLDTITNVYSVQQKITALYLFRSNMRFTRCLVNMGRLVTKYQIHFLQFKKVSFKIAHFFFFQTNIVDLLYLNNNFRQECVNFKYSFMREKGIAKPLKTFNQCVRMPVLPIMYLWGGQRLLLSKKKMVPRALGIFECSHAVS